MAIVAVANAIGGTLNQTTGTFISVPADGTWTDTDPVPLGTIVFVGVACDNSGTGGTSPLSGLTDNGGNTYIEVVTTTQTGGVARDGVTIALYVASCHKAPGTVQVNFATGTLCAAGAFAFSGVSPDDYSSNSVKGNGTTYNSGNTASASMASGDLIIGVVGSESTVNPSLDTDTTNGSWVGVRTSGGLLGSGAMGVAVQYKIVTASGTQTMNGNVSTSDWAAAWALYKPQGVVNTTQVRQAVSRAATR